VKVLYALSKYPQLSETYITAEIAFMLRQGVDVRVWSPFTRLPDVRPQTICYADTLAHAMQTFKPDVVHVHHLSVAHGVCKQLEAFKVPITIRGHSFDFSPEAVNKLAALPNVERIYIFPHFPRKVVHHKVFALPVGYDSTKYRPEPAKDRSMVLRLGAGLTTKNLDDFFTVAKLCPGFKFILGLASCDDESRVAHSLMAKYPKTTVTIFRDVSWEAAEGLTKKAGIFLHTSDEKSHPFGMPISIAEALAAGSTVMIRNTMEAREYAGDAALYYNTPEEAAETINITLAWTPEARRRQFERSVLQSTFYADTAVLPRILHDWQAFAKSGR